MDNNRKKILIITFPQGGPWVWAQNLAQELRQKGHPVEILTGRKNYFFGQFKKCDVLHSCVSFPFPFAKKYVLTIKGDYKKEKLLGQIFFPLAIAMADSVTVPSEFLKKESRIKKAIVIPNGVHLPESTRMDYDLRDNAPTLGILTNFDFQEKAAGVVKLAHIVQKIAPQAKILVGGQGEYFKEYQRQAKEIFPAIEFLGQCQKEDLFSKIDVFTYYSGLDNQPNALLEAMAAGLPIVSNDVGAVKEILIDKAAFYLARDDQAYGNILKKLIDSVENRRTCGETAKQIARQFAWDKLIQNYIELYGS